MLKKRVIFCLLFCNGDYMLSRNFRLQKVGDLNWLRKNYVFSKISFSIDELVVLNVSRGDKDEELFKDHLKKLTEECFIPVAAGGGIRQIEQTRALLRSGADKIVLNSAIFTNPQLVHSIAGEFGQQCIVASIDVMKVKEDYKIFIENGTKEIQKPFSECLNDILKLPIGEIYLNSMDRDGTGQGYLNDLIDILPKKLSTPIIIAGGAGKYHHLTEGLKNDKVDAVATAHLFNFVGDGLEKSREGLINSNISLPVWDVEKFKTLKFSNEDSY
jgi:imidazole glycerol-phosphate synthase subunit HisF